MNKHLYLLIVLFCFALSACASGATVGVGGHGGSYGAGGGIGISFPVGGDGSGDESATQTQGTQQQGGSEEPTLEHDPAAVDAMGQSAGNYIGSNLQRPYPKHNCDQPMKPSSDDSHGMYMIYKQRLDKYRLCIDTYAKNAKNDMQDIEAKANSALREYRLFVTRP